jgi:hypothetical protein
MQQVVLVTVDAVPCRVGEHGYVRFAPFASQNHFT